MNAVIHTIGHGNRSGSELIDLLQLCSIGCLADVRAHPGSRRHPQFGREALSESLVAAGIEYVWSGDTLGGRRRSRAHSPHSALRNESFRAYADHMESDTFCHGVATLLDIATAKRVAIMCAERLPWQCHRFMISDYLVAQGHEVRHVIDASPPRVHVLRPEARVTECGLIYDNQTQSSLRLD